MLCDAGRGNIETVLIFYKELHRDVRYHLISNVYINDMIGTVEAAKQRVTVGEDAVSGLTLRMISWGY